MKLFKNNLYFFVLFIVILAIALFVRFYDLSNVPNGFHIDEAIIADNANFILNTGRDTNNNFLPLQTEVFGDYNPTGYAYLAVVPIKILGLTIFAARSVGAMLGVLAVLGVGFLTYALFEKKNLSLLAAFFTALSPWDIILSRSTEETASSLVFIVFGFALLIWAIKKEKIKYLIFGTLLLFISYFMYFTPRFFIPLIFMTLFIPLRFWYEKRKALFTKIFLGCFLFLSITSALLIVGVNGGSSRFNQVSIFGFPETKLVMEEKIREDGGANLPVIITRVFHNKPYDYFLTFTKNYLEYFSGSFLFVKGGFPVWLSAPSVGLIYVFELPFILYGIYLLFKERKPWAFIVLLWLLLSPVAASLTVDDIPNVRRALVMVPAVEILTAYGLLMAINNIPKVYRNLAIIFLAVLFVFNSFYFLHQYFLHSTNHRNWYRYEAFDKVMQIVKRDYPNYDKIVVSKVFGGIYPQVLFFMDYDPSLYLKAGFPKDRVDTGFGKFFFVQAACPSIDGDPQVPNVKKIIYIEDGSCRDYPELAKRKHIKIVRKDKTKAYRIVYK